LALVVAWTAPACQSRNTALTAPFLIGSLATGDTQLGTLSGLYTAPGNLMIVSDGLLGQRFGVKGPVLAGLLLKVAGGRLAGAGSSFGTSQRVGSAGRCRSKRR